MILRKIKIMRALRDLDNIHLALCSLDISGAFRASYIQKQVDDLNYILDKKGKRRKRYARCERRLRDSQ